jgi:hypothetical protein
MLIVPIPLQVYADRFMRVWDVHSGRCLMEVFTGHKMGETVMALAIDPSNQLLATADSAGYIKVDSMEGGREERGRMAQGEKGPRKLCSLSHSPHPFQSLPPPLHPSASPIFSSHILTSSLLPFSPLPCCAPLSPLSPFLQLWDTSDLQLRHSSGGTTAGASQGGVEVKCIGSIQERCVWRGHQVQVTKLEWTEQPNGCELS